MVRRRSSAVLLAVLLALLPALPPAAAAPEAAGGQLYREWIARGRAALAAADPAAAEKAFEQAANLIETSEAELGLVGAWLQDGEYRRALAFVAHTAGGHQESSDAVAVHVWLLQAGGQVDVARRLLGQARQRLPKDALLAQLDRSLSAPLPRAGTGLLAFPVHLGPWPDGRALPRGARLAATGVLVDGGRRALVPAAALQQGQQFWLRSGLGAARAASLDAAASKGLSALGLAVLQLESALPFATPPALAQRDAFPGSVGYSVEYAAPGPALPAWPLLRGGILGNPDATGARQLGIELPPGPRGGAVFDAGGRLVGIALAQRGKPSRMITPSQLRQHAAWLGFPAAERGAPVGVDQIYEAALPLSLQLIVAD